MTTVHSRKPGSSRHPTFHIALLLFAAALVSCAIRLCRTFAFGAWLAPENLAQTMQSLTIRYELLPRVAVCLLAGASLGLSGAIMQRILRNPLAEPTTIGVTAGAQLALMTATLFAPSLIVNDREWVALGGGLSVAVLVFATTFSRALSPLSLILCGLVVGLLCNMIAGILTLFRWQYLGDFFFWSSGSLAQNDWSVAAYLAPRLGICAPLIAILARPLSILALNDENARSLGLSLRSIRFMALGLAVLLASFVTSAVGMIGFIGLAAPVIARMLGAAQFNRQLVWSPIIGASLLWLADESTQWAGMVIPGIPTGVATALLGAPMLFWLLPRLKPEGLNLAQGHSTTRRSSRPVLTILGLLAILVAVVWIALDVGRSVQGWSIDNWGDMRALSQWRVPRTMAALFAGCMLAVAGTLIQRMTGNPMASPEVLGISSGASIGLITLLLAVSAPTRLEQIAAGAAGAFLTLATILFIGRHSAFAPERLLLTGVAICTVFGAFVSFLLISGDPRLGMLLTLMAGSTYHVTSCDAIASGFVAIVGLLLALAGGRWLTILPLGDPCGRSLGINLAVSRLSMLMVVSILTAAAALIVGPLSFVGLMGPHLTWMMGLRRASDQIVASAILGAIILTAADWLGRNLMFPYQLPAGLLASLVGAGFFLWHRNVKRALVKIWDLAA